MKTTQNSQSLTPFTHIHRELIHAQFKNERLELINLLNVGDRSIERFIERAYDGFKLLLDRKRKYYHYNAIPLSDAFIECEKWRYEVAKVIGLNKWEVQIIENLLIASKCLQYRDSDKTFLMCIDQVQQIYMPDDDTGKAFNEWLEMPRE